MTTDLRLKSFLTTDALDLRQTLYHYTSFEGFKGIAREGHIWATHSDYLNDSSEARHLINVVARNVKDWKLSNETDYMSARNRLLSLMKEALATQHFISSFSEVGDSLSQWRAYCKRGGISLGFSPKALLGARTLDNLGNSISGVRLDVIKVRYISDGLFSEATNDLLQFFSIWQAEAENPEQRRNLFEGILSDLVCHYKHDGFSEEREWRLVVSDDGDAPNLHDFRSSESMLVPYTVVRLLGSALVARSLDQIITEVIVGPGPHMELSEKSIKMYFAQRGLNMIPVKCSSIPYRDW